MSFFNETPSLLSVLAEHKAEIFKDLSCFKLARVKKFNATNQTIDVDMLYQEVDLSKPTPQFNDSMRMQDIPIYLPTSKNGGFNYPVEIGDEVLIVFLDNEFSDWFSDKFKNDTKTYQVKFLSQHALSNGIAFLWNNPSNYSKDKTVMNYKNASLEMKEEDIILNYNDKAKITMNSNELKIEFGNSNIVLSDAKVVVQSDAVEIADAVSLTLNENAKLVIPAGQVVTQVTGGSGAPAQGVLNPSPIDIQIVEAGQTKVKA